MALLAATLGVLPEGWAAQLVSCALCLWIVQAVAQWYRLRHIPGPASAGWSKWWQLSGALSGSYHEKMSNACNKYGSLVRIGPKQLLTSDPELLKRMAAPRSKYGKGLFYSSGRIVPGVDNVVSTRDEEKHKKMRAEMAPAFSIRPNSRQSFEAGIDRQLLSFISMLERNYLSPTDNPTSVDLAEKTQFFALDVIGDIFMSEPFGYLAADKDLYDYNQINMTSLPAMNFVSVLPGLTDIIHKWPLRLVMPKEGDKVGFGRLMSTVRSFVDKRLDSKEHFDDMMQILIESGVSREQLIQQTLIAVIAGSNSTAHALRMVLYGLMTTPRAMHALLAEIDALGSTASYPISWSEIQKLPYLMAAVQEGLRMWPPVAGLGFKTVPPAGEYIHGYWVPGGTEIGQAFHAVGRSKELWGDDADLFRPERWLEASSAEARTMAAAVDTHFGGGKFSCLGKPIAMMEIHKAVFELVKRFDMTIVNPDSPIKVTACVFVFATDFWIKLRHRKH